MHPKAKDERQQEIFNGIVNDNLPVPYTWETELSALGQRTFATEEERRKAFRAKWEELIDSGKLGYMALLRNLRNILEAEVSADHILTVGKRLSSEKAVLITENHLTFYLIQHGCFGILSNGHSIVHLRIPWFLAIIR